MQGRLSAQVDGKIQAFPWDAWESEFPAAERLEIPLMEWTLDQHRLRENPLMTAEGQARIRALERKHKVQVASVTGDCFMQAPFHKKQGAERAALLSDLRAILDACAALEARHLVFPLVDQGRIESDAQAQALLEGLLPLSTYLKGCGVQIVFESDYPPGPLREFIAQFPRESFGINYDIGNSASLGFDAREEIAAYGSRICHVHVKDRVLGGTTVPLGQGNARFPAVCAALREQRYAGDFILQTARAADGDHAGALRRYRDAFKGWWSAGEPGTAR